MRFIADSLAQNGSYTTVGTAPTRGDACTPPAGKARTGSVASFFFSTLGPAAQMSTAGFLKSVLLQLLSANPGLIAAVSPSRWEVMSLFGEDPQPLEKTELKLLLLETLRQLGRDSCTLIIIDALDECQKHETFSDMLHLISEMPACREVKVCISSRPLANLGAVMSSFLLLDLDKSYPVVEMERYIAAEMDQRLASTLPPEAESRVRTCLAEKASGCFLWVDLSVYNLPPGLDELLALLLQELHESHPFIAQALHLIACSENSNSLLRLYVMKMSLAGPGLPREISSSLLEDVDSQVMECAREILAKSKSLLVLDEPTEHSSPGKETDQVLDARLRLVHPRVKDVLDAESILRTPAGTIDEVLDSAALYCESSLAVLELYRMGYLAGLGMPTEVLRCASSVLFAWSWDETRIMRVLDELECASQQLLEPISYIEAHALSPWNITPPVYDSANDLILHLPGAEQSASVQHRPSIGKLQQKVIRLCTQYNFGCRILFIKSECKWPDVLKAFDCIYLTPAVVKRPESSPTTLCPGQSSIRANIGVEAGATKSVAQVLSKEEDSGNGLVNSADSVIDMIPSQAGIWDLLPHPVLNKEQLLDPESDDESWESFSSDEEPLDPNHPIMVLEEEITQALREGFQKCCEELEALNH
ncbi:hypothetical protein S40288_09884 [Stachybotrys chartarum IBT 40288]|nr:hypothetical protein S40288_09884 [Stachybotrys chartarum IBT 40288]